jgi:cystathionine gamma-synthase
MLPSHPSHSVALAQMRGAGGVVSFVVKGGRAAAGRLVDACQLATIAPSLGGVETLIEQPALMSYSELSDEELQSVGIDPALIRLSVGIEEQSDVLADIEGALRAI